MAKTKEYEKNLETSKEYEKKLGNFQRAMTLLAFVGICRFIIGEWTTLTDGL